MKTDVGQKGRCLATKRKYQKVIYRSPREFMADFLYVLRNRRKIGRMMKSGAVSPSFRERLMLAVTGVNRCRYCSHVHTGIALKSGLQKDEINRLLSGLVEGCPPGEVIAVLYAQHWASTSGKPSSESVESLEREYGAATSEGLHVLLRMIRAANLAGNTWDYILYRLSFGRLSV